MVPRAYNPVNKSLSFFLGTSSDTVFLASRVFASLSVGANAMLQGFDFLRAVRPAGGGGTTALHVGALLQVQVEEGTRGGRPYYHKFGVYFN
jgi:hypothetical protein